MAKKIYDLRLKPGFPATSRSRGGITVPAASGIQTELTDEQLATFQADPEVVVREASSKEVKAQEDLQAEQRRLADEAAKQAETDAQSAPKAPTKKDLIADAKARGLDVKVTEKNTVEEITAAIDAAASQTDVQSRQMVDTQDTKEA